MKTPRLIAVLVVALSLLVPATGAAAGPAESLDARVARVLAEFPGGVEVSPGVIQWNKGAITLTLESAFSVQSIGSCATGQYCAWTGLSYTGTKLAFTSCSAGGTSSSLAALGGPARSTANARTTGTVNAVNSGALVYTMAANTGKPSNAATLTHLVCFT